MATVYYANTLEDAHAAMEAIHERFGEQPLRTVKSGDLWEVRMSAEHSSYTQEQAYYYALGFMTVRRGTTSVE